MPFISKISDYVNLLPIPLELLSLLNIVSKLQANFMDTPYVRLRWGTELWLSEIATFG